VSERIDRARAAFRNGTLQWLDETRSISNAEISEHWEIQARRLAFEGRRSVVLVLYTKRGELVGHYLLLQSREQIRLDGDGEDSLPAVVVDACLGWIHKPSD
jgi:hypothetical protein